MGMTISQKILARASGNEKVEPGEIFDANVDLLMIHEITGAPAIRIFEKEFGGQIWDPNKIIVVEDHSVPCKDVRAAENIATLKRFVEKQNIPRRHYYPYGLGQYGVCHALLPEEGLVLPGMLVLGGDSHTCTYGALGAFSTGIGHSEVASIMHTGQLWLKVPETSKFVINGKLPPYVMAKDIILKIIGDIGVDGATYQAMEFSGTTISKMDVEERLVLSNMSVEAGAKTGIVEPDSNTARYLINRTEEKWRPVINDSNAEYVDVREYSAEELEPLVAKPSLPSNVIPVRELEGMLMDQAYIGSCTGGRISDLRRAAEIIKGKEVKIRTIVVPTTLKTYKQALKEGLIEIFADAGAVIGPPTCGACLGGHMGILGPGEKCISTTNRNFVGRMGSKESEVFLASPYTVAAAAVMGYVCDPEKLRG